MKTRSRVTIFAVAALVAGAPAVAFHAFCVGRSCDAVAGSANNTPFCSLPFETRSAIANGFYERRSGEIIAVSDIPVSGGSGFGDRGPAWPSVPPTPAAAAVVLVGNGVEPGSSLPQEMGLDDVAPSIATLIGLERPHAEVRSGAAVDTVETPTGAIPRLVVEIVWKDVSATELEDAVEELPNVEALVVEGASTFSADPASLPLDPAALVTTVASGAVPSDHGMTGTLLRNDRGELVEAWAKGSPINVIATLGDHLDELTRNNAVIGGVGTDVADRGIIGGRWFPNADRDPFTTVPTADVDRQTDAAIRLLREHPFGRDSTVDLLGLVQSGTAEDLDAGLGRVLEEARKRSGGSLLVALTALGADDPQPVLSADALGRRVERSVPGSDVLEGLAPGSFYLNQKVLARRKLSDDVVLRSLYDLKHEGTEVFADAFPAIAITFGRYCDG